MKQLTELKNVCFQKNTWALKAFKALNALNSPKCDKHTRDKRFEGRVALVLGASSGIGRATAINLASNGAKVVIAARRKDVLEAVTEEIHKMYSGSCKYIVCDVLKLQQIENAVKFAVQHFGKIDIAVNSAGLEQLSADILDTTENEFDAIMNVNTKGTYFFCKSVITQMRKQSGRNCSIINVSSVYGVVARGTNAIYCGAKHAVNGFTKSLSKQEVSLNSNIRINSVCPGTVKTDMITRVCGSNASVKNQPEEVAAVISFLASDDASFIDGSIITADGGLICN